MGEFGCPQITNTVTYIREKSREHSTGSQEAQFDRPCRAAGPFCLVTLSLEGAATVLVTQGGVSLCLCSKKQSGLCVWGGQGSLCSLCFSTEYWVVYGLEFTLLIVKAGNSEIEGLLDSVSDESLVVAISSHFDGER